MHALVLGLVPGLRSGPRHVRRQRRRHRRADRAAQPRRARRDRGRGAAGREGRDRGGAAVPGALRRRDGHPAHDRRRTRGSPARSSCRRPDLGRRHRRPAEAAPRTPPTPHRPKGAPEERRHRGRRGRRGRRPRRRARPRGRTPSPRRVPFITRTLPPFEVLTEEGLELDRAQRRRILEQVGIEFRDAPDALRAVQGRRAPTWTANASASPRAWPALVQATAPREFVQYARNPENNVQIGGMHTVFAPAYGSPFVRDLDGAGATARSRTSGTS